MQTPIRATIAAAVLCASSSARSAIFSLEFPAIVDYEVLFDGSLDPWPAGRACAGSGNDFCFEDIEPGQIGTLKASIDLATGWVWDDWGVVAPYIAYSDWDVSFTPIAPIYGRGGRRP